MNISTIIILFIIISLWILAFKHIIKNGVDCGCGCKNCKKCNHCKSQEI